MSDIHSKTKERENALLSFCFFLFIFLFLLKNPKLASEAITDSLRLCVNKVIPSLFPMSVLCGILMKSSFPFYAEKVLSRPMKKVFSLSGAAALPFAVGCLSGYPLGVKCAAELYENGVIGKEETERVICFSNNAGPGFVILTVGITFFHSLRIGFLLYTAQLSAAILIGLFFRKKKIETKECPSRCETLPFGEAITLSIRESAQNTLFLSAFVVFFSLIGRILSLFFLRLSLPESFSSLIIGFFEITGGIDSASSLGRTGIPIAAFLIGWSSLSVHMQSSLFIIKNRLNFRRYLSAKLTQGILTMLLTSAFLAIKG